MDTRTAPAERTSELKRALLGAVQRFRIKEAESAYRELTDECGLDPDSDEMLPFRVTLGIFGGRMRDMLCMLNNLGEDRAPELKAVCLRLMGDPLWEGTAMQVEQTSSNPDVRASMRALLAGRGSNEGHAEEP